MENCVETASVVMVSELSIGLGEGCQVFRLVLFGCAWWHWYQCGLCTIGVYVGFLHYGVPITGDKAETEQRKHWDVCSSAGRENYFHVSGESPDKLRRSTSCTAEPLQLQHTHW